MQLRLKLSAIALWKINVMLTLHELGSRLNRRKRVGRLISVYALRGLLKLRVVRFITGARGATYSQLVLWRVIAVLEEK